MTKGKTEDNWSPLQQLRDARRDGDAAKAKQALHEVAGINDGWWQWATEYRGAAGQLARGVR